LKKQIVGWAIHTLTASGAFVGLLALYAIHQHYFIEALWLVCVAIIIDAIDGMFARACDVKTVLPSVDGALLDNIVDFFTYTLVPCFFLLVSDLLPPHWRVPCVFVITLASAYQFTQVDAKTYDHFFKGFPSYWNIAVFYLFFWQMSSVANLVILLALAILSFVPIKYVYPTRLDYLSANSYLRIGMGLSTILWGAASIWLLWLYPATNYWLASISLLYILFYTIISLYRTKFPLSVPELVTK
jgi:phosphatidylcholine synthase